MSPELLLRDVFFCALRIAVVIGCGLLLLELLRIRSARFRLGAAHALLGCALLLPFVPSGRGSSTTAATEVKKGVASTVGLADQTRVEDGDVAPTTAAVAGAVLGLLAAGVGLRALWLALGLGRLSRLRRRGEPVDPLPPGTELPPGLDSLLARARFYRVPLIPSPVSVGVWRPSVLLPPLFWSLPPDQRSAVLCHELVHVRRRDGLVAILEEGLRALLWFHPAIWLLLRRASLWREQVVDGEVVRLLGNRRPYLEALLRFATPTTSSWMLPGTPMLKIRQLEARVRALLKESSMSKTHTRFSLALCAVVVVPLVAWSGRAFPLSSGLLPEIGGAAAPGLERAEPSQKAEPSAATGTSTGTGLSQKTQPSQKVQPAPKAPPSQQTGSIHRPVRYVTGDVRRPVRKHHTRPEYTEIARRARIQGVAILQTVIERDGSVGSVKVLKGLPMGLSEAAVEAVKQWTFEPATLDGEPVAVYYNLTVNFALDDAAQPGPPGFGLPERAIPAAKKYGEAPDYTEAAREAGIEGTVVLRATVDDRGRVRRVEVVDGLPFGLSESAAAAVYDWGFEPALLDGRSVSSTVQLKVEFELD